MNKMNKLLITSAIAYSMVSANASPLFIQVDGGSTKIKSILGSDTPGISKPKFTLTDKNTATARLTIGITEDNRTVALDYTHFNKVKDRLSNSHISAETEAKGFSVGLQGRLQHDIGRFSPYIGLRAFYTKLDYNYKDVVLNPLLNTLLSQNDKRTFGKNESLSSYGVGIMLGVNLRVTNHLSLHTGAEYNYPLNIYNHNGDEIQQMSFNAGLRVNF